MGFKLVRVDAPEPAKIPLNTGTQIIGRGSFPDCNDNRMSRKHALVVVTGETVTLKSLHQNPCFYSISNAHQTLMLPQGKTVSLKSGDHFGLLPDANWYELIYYKECAESANPTSMVEENRISLSESFLGTFSTQYGNKQVSGVTENSENLITNDKSTKSYKCKNDDGHNDSGPSTLSLELERDDENTQVIEPQPSTSCFNSRNQVPNDPNTTPNELSQTGLDETYCNVQSPPSKRSHSPDRIPDAKKVKTEPESPEKTNTQAHDPHITIEPQMSMDTEPQDANTESHDPINVNMDLENPDNGNTAHPNDADDKKEQDPTDANTEPQNPIDMNTEPQNPTDMNTDSLGPNDANIQAQEPRDGDTEANSSNGNEVKKEPQSPKDEKDVKKDKDPDAAQPGPSQAQPGCSNDDNAPPKPPARPARERCVYGANCYRKNPQHKIQFSHPGEADYGQGDKGQCPYGADCRRRDVRHWETHEHPPGAAQPAQNQDPNNRQGIRVVQRRGQIFYINAHSVHFHDDHYELENQDGDRVDYDYEF